MRGRWDLATQFPCLLQAEATTHSGHARERIQLLLQAEPGPNQQRLLEALHCLSARPASDTLPAPLCSPACVARLLLLASDAELMSGGDQVRPLASLLCSRSRTLRPLYSTFLLAPLY